LTKVKALVAVSFVLLVTMILSYDPLSSLAYPLLYVW